MKRENYHLHTTISDGKLKPEELIKLAIKKNLDTIGITDHYHLPRDFKEEKNDFYSEKDYKTLRRLQRKYKNKINVLVGVEFDWLPDHKSWIIKETKKRDYDCKFLSVHFVKVGGKYDAIDLFSDKFDESIKDIGIKKLVEGYYSSLRDGIKTECFDVVAHMDLVKMWNKNHKYFSGNENWYTSSVKKTLNLIKKKNMKIEINTKGWKKDCHEQYPAEWILKKAIKLGIPILIGTDGHTKEDIDYKLGKARSLLKKLS